METIFMDLSGRRSLSPRVFPSRAPVLSCAHNLQAPASQASSQPTPKIPAARGKKKLWNPAEYIEWQ